MLTNQFMEHPGHSENPVLMTEQAFRAFMKASAMARNLMTPHFARFGLTGAQWAVLRALQRAENEGLDGLRPSSLGQRLLIKRPSVTGVVERLRRSGWVASREGDEDHRSKKIMLTKEGRRLMKRVLKHHPDQQQKMLSCLSQAEQRTLAKLSEKLASHYETLNTSPSAHAELEDLHS
jgi:DNA-binding MarR family transcriptional regulator